MTFHFRKERFKGTFLENLIPHCRTTEYESIKIFHIRQPKLFYRKKINCMTTLTYTTFNGFRHRLGIARPGPIYNCYFFHHTFPSLQRLYQI